MMIRRVATRVGLILALVCGVPLGSAADELNGEGWVRGRIDAERSLVIGDAIYHLTPRTVIRGLEGEPLGYEDLTDVLRVESAARAPRRVVTWARYDATEVRGRLVLNWLELSHEHEGADTGDDPT
jgi:hypothetical protein